MHAYHPTPSKTSVSTRVWAFRTMFCRATPRTIVQHGNSACCLVDDDIDLAHGRVVLLVVSRVHKDFIEDLVDLSEI